MSLAGTETLFISPFLLFLSLSSQPGLYTDSFQQDLSKVDTLGPSLPKLPTEARAPVTPVAHAERLVTVVVKSVKPPKFSQTLSVSLASTVYSLKERLVEGVAELSGVEVAQLKFLVRGKVLADTTVLDAVAAEGSELALMCMVGKPAVAPLAVEAEPEMEVEENVTALGEEQWSAIRSALSSSYTPGQTDAVILRLKAGWSRMG